MALLNKYESIFRTMNVVTRSYVPSVESFLYSGLVFYTKLGQVVITKLKLY